MAHDQEARAILHARIANDVQYHAPDENARASHEEIREATEHLAHLYIEICPPGRELSMALTKLIDEAMAHANAAVARNHARTRPPMEWADG
jgi:hypothetical protein